MITIRTERPIEAQTREALLDAAYGPARHGKPSARLRDGRLPASGLSLVALDRGRMVGTVRLWHVSAGRGRPALLLGPLAVHPAYRGRGIGSALMRQTLAAAAERGYAAVLLVGDAAYYGRFGLSPDKTGALRIAGADPARLLGIELKTGALDGAHGAIAATGERQRTALPGALPPIATVRPRLQPRAA
jgi:predicted N-acetyltransferase YhbS